MDGKEEEMVGIAIMVGVGVLWGVTRNYNGEAIRRLDKKEHPLRIWYPTACWLYHKVGSKIRWGDSKKDALQAVYVTESVEDAQLWFVCKIISLLLVIILAVGGFLGAAVMRPEEKTLVDGKYLVRPQVGELSREVELGVSIDGGGKGGSEGERFGVEARRYTETEAREAMRMVKEELPSAILGGNTGRDDVRQPLDLVNGSRGIRIQWEVDGERVDLEGGIDNEDVAEEGEPLTLRAKLVYGEWEDALEIPIVVRPPNYTEGERLWKDWDEATRRKGEESLTDKLWELPTKVNGKAVTYREEKDGLVPTIALLGALCLVITPYLFLMDLESGLRKRNREMLLDYPEVMNKFTLLLGAGMTVKGAWGKITAEYVGKKKKGLCSQRYVYEEMLATWNEMANGRMERTAYERFGRRVRLTPYTKFSALVSQNMKKGNARLLSILELEGMDAWEERKETVKRLGEEAGSKLLLPMMLMFGIVLAIIIVPAMMTF